MFQKVTGNVNGVLNVLNVARRYRVAKVENGKIIIPNVLFVIVSTFVQFVIKIIRKTILLLIVVNVIDGCMVTVMVV